MATPSRPMTHASSRSSAMSRNYPADTAKQRFMEESYNKETSIRLGWYFSDAGRKYRSGDAAADDGDDVGGSKSRQTEVSRRRIEEGCPKPTSALLRLRDRRVDVPDYRKRAFRIDGLPVAPVADRPAAVVDPPPAEMRPPDEATSAKLYTGFSHDGRGRHDYLCARRHLAPDERYRNPVVSSFEYGWGLADVLPEPVKPTHARSRRVNDTFYSRNGISTLVVPAIN